MESTNNPLHQILPPRLEDAGLEECALPPQSIKEAFLKAASAVKSRAASVLHNDDESACLKDPWPTEDSSDVGPCGGEKGGHMGGFDEVKVADDEDEVGDEVIVGEEERLGEGGRDCVDGLRGLDIEDEEGKKKEREEKTPTLVEGFV